MVVGGVVGGVGGLLVVVGSVGGWWWLVMVVIVSFVNVIFGRLGDMIFINCKDRYFFGN